MDFLLWKHRVTSCWDTSVAEYNKRHAQVIFVAVILSTALLLAASAYVSIQGSKVLDYNSDSFVSTFMAADWRPGGTVNLVTQHTNLIKYPILALQGWIHYSYFTYLLVNILLVSTATLGWSYLVWLIFNRSFRAFAASNFMLTGLLLGSTALVISSVSTTTRNIEYPLALLYLIVLQNLIKTGDKTRWIVGAVLIALLVSSDFIFLYSLVPASIFVLVWFWWNDRLSTRQLLTSASNVILGTAAGLFLLKVLDYLHVLSLTGRHAGSLILFMNLPHDIYNTFGQILQLSGGFFLGSPIKISFSGQILNFLFVLISIVAAYSILRRFNREHPSLNSTLLNFLPVTLTFWAITLCAFYILLGQAGDGAGDNSRYLSIIPFIAVILQIAQAKYWRHKSSLVIITALVLVGGLMNSYHGYYSYQNSINYDPRVGIDKAIIAYSRSHDIQLVLGSYDYGPALRFYSHNNPQSYAILVCNNTFYFFSYNKWYLPQPSVKRSALVIDKYYSDAGRTDPYHSTNSCADSNAEKNYGTPANVVEVANHNGQPVYLMIYDYDIRARLKNSDVIFL